MLIQDPISFKYINLYRAKNYNDYISKSKLDDLDNLTLCQNEQIFTKDDLVNKCCKYDITTDLQQVTNYIEIYYKKKFLMIMSLQNSVCAL